MVSLRPLLSPSTALLRQFLPRHNTTLQFLARPFSQLSRLTINNGLRLLRSGNAAAATGQTQVGAVSGAVKQLEQVRGMKTRSSVKRLCDGCKVCGISCGYMVVDLVWEYLGLCGWIVAAGLTRIYFRMCSLCGERIGFTLSGELCFVLPTLWFHEAILYQC
jgi:large subunit ribosomal protein L36